VDEHELHSERGEQVQVVGEIVEAAVRNEVAAERDDEDLAAESVDVRRDGLEPVDETILTRQPLAPRRRAAAGSGFRFLFFSVRNERSRLPPRVMTDTKSRGILS
jgi:hypothetical protein